MTIPCPSHAPGAASSMRRSSTDPFEEGPARMAVGQHAELRLQFADRVAHCEIQMAVEIADLVVEGRQPVLKRNALTARGLHIVRGPGGANSRQAVQAVGQDSDGWRVSGRIIEALKHVEIVGDQERGTGGAAWEEQNRMAGGGQGAAVG